MAETNRATGLSGNNFRNPEEYQQWNDSVTELLRDLMRELEDSGELLGAKLEVTKVVNSQKNAADLRRENKVQARKIRRHLLRAATLCQTARNEVASSNQVFLQYWTKDGGLSQTTESARGKNTGMEMNKPRRGGSRRTTAAA